MEKNSSRISQWIKDSQEELAETIVNRIYSLKPEMVDMPNVSKSRERSLEDTNYHLAYLREAITASDTSLFVDYMEWVRVLFKGLNLPDEMLSLTLECMRDVLVEQLTGQDADEVRAYFEAALKKVQVSLEMPKSHIDSQDSVGELAGKYLTTLLEGNRHEASRMILEAVEKGWNVKDIYMKVFQPCQWEIGRLWQINKISVAQEHYCTAATQLIMSQLYPYIFSSEKVGKRLVAACVGGELHEIGMRMVADFFEMEGWDTYYIGANTPTSTILKALSEYEGDVLGLSATIVFHKEVLSNLIQKVRESELVRDVKILVGGYPFRMAPDLWKKVGADGFAPDAQEAVRLANRLVEKVG